MNPIKKVNRLSLHSETLRRLDNSMLARVAGGGAAGGGGFDPWPTLTKATDLDVSLDGQKSCTPTDCVDTTGVPPTRTCEW